MNVSHETVMQPSLWIHKTESDEIQMSFVRNKQVWGKNESKREKISTQTNSWLQRFSFEIKTKQKIK